MDFHGTLTEYENAKARLFQMIKKEGIGVLNGDDPAGERIQKRATGRTVLFGENNANVDYRIQEIRKDNQGMHFMVHFQDKTIKLITPLWGHFNMMNAAAAAVTGLETGLDPDTVRQGIQKVDCVKGRMEGFLAPGGFRVIVDYAHSPDALKNLLMATRELTEKRILAVFGCGGDRDKGKRSHMGQIGAAFADVVFVTSDNPRSETPESIIKDILKGIPSDRPIQVIEDRREAIYQALDQAEPGDTVVLAGKGHETYQQIGTKKYSFSDRKVAEEHLGLTARA
jgi:UDP-N-acetylmuramoyl-L-alanyl-D-glutamate--2,6-diaminopimelate ligase